MLEFIMVIDLVRKIHEGKSVPKEVSIKAHRGMVPDKLF